MKRALILLVSVAFMITLSALPASANWHKTHCRTEGWALHPTTTVCTTWGFRRQNDGDGLYVEGMTIDINRGCGNGMDTPRVQQSKAGWDTSKGKPNNGSIRSLGTGDCHFWKDLEMRGPDKGNIYVWNNLKLNMNWAPSYWWAMNTRLCARASC